MENRTLIEFGFAFILILFLISLLVAEEYSNEVSTDFVIGSENANLEKSSKSAFNLGYAIGILIILMFVIAILFLKKKKSKKKKQK